jgi:hypothetical protein
MRATGHRRGRALLQLAGVAMLAVAARAQVTPPADVVDLFAGMSASLSVLNPEGFLAGIDKNAPEYDTLARSIRELLSQGDVSSSIEFVKDEGDGQKRVVELDWYLEIKTAEAAGPLVRRREVIACRVEKQKKGWKVVSLKPVKFFAPVDFTG